MDNDSQLTLETPMTKMRKKRINSPVEEAIGDQPKRWNQTQPNDYIRDMEMSKEKVEISASRIKQMGCLEDDVTICHFGKRTDDLKKSPFTS